MILTLKRKLLELLKKYDSISKRLYKKKSIAISTNDDEGYKTMFAEVLPLFFSVEKEFLYRQPGEKMPLLENGRIDTGTLKKMCFK